MSQDQIVIQGARQHNLKNINVSIPRDQLVVITGLSGSGKSSLAFDTIYAEGQRRYVESLSAYARQFLGQMDKPDLDFISGLSPAISIDQKTTSRNPRSTVGTVTEIYDYLRLLYARIGEPHCPQCDRPITQQTVSQMVDQVLSLPQQTRLQVLGPVVRGRKGEFKKVFEEIRREGFVRVRVDGEVRSLEEEIDLEKNKQHTIEVVVDRLVVREGIENRLAESLEAALRIGQGVAWVQIIDGEEMVFSENLACVHCGIGFEELSPRMFSFNSPFGACPACDGLGVKKEFDPELVVDSQRSIEEGALLPYAETNSQWYWNQLRAVMQHWQIPGDRPFGELSPEHQEIILNGTTEKIPFIYTNQAGRSRTFDNPYRGVIPELERRYRETSSDSGRESIEIFMSSRDCHECAGARLRPEARAVRVGGRPIHKLVSLSIREADAFFAQLTLNPRQAQISREIVKEIRARLGFLLNVGLDYLTLDRMAGTLSGGEAQRIRLATQIGSSLMGVLYILDEPSIGLHQRDNERLLQTLRGLQKLGNTVIVVEHDEDTIRMADHIIDMGPGAGAHGGEVVAQGSIEDLMAEPLSLTGQYLSGARAIPIPSERRQPDGRYLMVRGARENNLKNIDVAFPLGLMVAVTGVSGSGKSTLVNEILQKRLAQALHRTVAKPGAHKTIEGLRYVDKVINIDQSPIGRTPRSNPATYTGLFDPIREVFSQTQESRARGYLPGRFSFNVKGGRCEACKGDGIIKIEMHFLPDVYVPCEVCKGKRYNRETLQIHFKGKSIADVLEMRVEDALEFFSAIPKIRRKLETLYDVGLGYIRLGQPATTLSGGEAQRVKLATELSRRSNGGTVYILDEPTTGLHTADIHRLLEVLSRLTDGGSTVIIIEHNLDVIKTADHIIDLGPEGGSRGGEVVATGTPEEIAQNPHSHTGRFLRPVLGLGSFEEKSHA